MAMSAPDTAILPDAAAGNWVDRHAPPALRPWLKLGRFDRPAGIWLLMLPGWQGIALAAAGKGEWPNPWLLIAFLPFIGGLVLLIFNVLPGTTGPNKYGPDPKAGPQTDTAAVFS